VFVKKDIPVAWCAGYRRLKNKSGRGRRTAKEHRVIVETRKGTKTDRAGLGKGNAVPRTELHFPP
jgi:hypothetical protein